MVSFFFLYYNLFLYYYIYYNYIFILNNYIYNIIDCVRAGVTFVLAILSQLFYTKTKYLFRLSLNQDKG